MGMCVGQRGPSRKRIQLEAVGVTIVALGQGLVGCSSNDSGSGNAPAGDMAMAGAGGSVVSPPSSPQGGTGTGVADQSAEIHRPKPFE